MKKLLLLGVFAFFIFGCVTPSPAESPQTNESPQVTTPNLECTQDSDCTGSCGGPNAPAGYEDLVKACRANMCVCTTANGQPFQ